MVDDQSIVCRLVDSISNDKREFGVSVASTWLSGYDGKPPERGKIVVKYGESSTNKQERAVRSKCQSGTEAPEFGEFFQPRTKGVGFRFTLISDQLSVRNIHTLSP